MSVIHFLMGLGLHTEIAIFSVFFSVLFITVRYNLSVLFPKWWIDLSVDDKTEVPPCFVNCVHHCFVVPFGLYYMYTYAVYGIYMPTETLTFLVPITLGYLIADTIFFAIPQAITTKSGDYIIHHVLGIYLTYIVANSEEASILIFVSSMFVTEISTILLNMSIIIGTTTYKATNIGTYLEYAFAIAFVITRIFNLTYQTVICVSSTESVGYGKYCLIPLLLLQYYWLYKIAKHAMTVINPKKKE